MMMSRAADVLTLLFLSGMLAVAGCAAERARDGGEERSPALKGEKTPPAPPRPKSAAPAPRPAAPAPAARNGGGAPEAALPGREVLPAEKRTVRLLVRDFLVQPGGADPSYGYYSYLIFTEQSSATLSQRRDAAKAFMCQPDAGEGQRLDIAPASLGIFYAPIRRAGDRPLLRTSRSGDDLMKEGVYDYGFAQDLANGLGLGGLKMGILAYPAPLKRGAAINREALSVVNLSAAAPDRIEMIVEVFRARLTVPREDQWQEAEVEVPGPGGRTIKKRLLIPRLTEPAPLASRFRSVLASLGSLVDALSPPSAQADAVCR